MTQKRERQSNHAWISTRNKIKSDEILDKLKVIGVVRGDLKNKEMVGDTWDPTESMRNQSYFLVYSSKHKSRVHKLF